MATNQAGGSPTFTLSGQPGYEYFIQVSPDLINWSTITTLMNTNGIVSFTDPGYSGYNQRFYRAIASY